MKKITVNVTKNEIDNAVRSDSHHCMIADAIQREIPSAKYIMVDLQSIRFSNVKNGMRYIYMTPPIAQKAIIDFDHGKATLAPFKFTMNSGYSRVMRVRQGDFEENRKATKQPKRKNQKKRYMPARHREFGLRAIV